MIHMYVMHLNKIIYFKDLLVLLHNTNSWSQKKYWQCHHMFSIKLVIASVFSSYYLLDFIKILF